MINNKLSILIILYEENYQIVNKCLEQIKDHRIIVIDNANDQSLKDKIIKNHKIYKYFLNKKNVGFSKAANQGILECDTEYLLILGADCLITNKDIRQLIFAKEKYENCCSVDCIEISKLPEVERLELRKGIENKKMYYSHKKVKLNLKETE